jgi:hypothetical protein
MFLIKSKTKKNCSSFQQKNIKIILVVPWLFQENSVANMIHLHIFRCWKWKWVQGFSGFGIGTYIYIYLRKISIELKLVGQKIQAVQMWLTVDNNLLSYLFFSQDVRFLNLNDFIFLKNIIFLKKIW